MKPIFKEYLSTFRVEVQKGWQQLIIYCTAPQIMGAREVIAELREENNQLRAQMEYFKTRVHELTCQKNALQQINAQLESDNVGMLNAGGYAYMSKQRDQAGQRSYQAVAYAGQMKARVKFLEQRVAELVVLTDKAICDSCLADQEAEKRQAIQDCIDFVADWQDGFHPLGMPKRIAVDLEERFLPGEAVGA